MRSRIIFAIIVSVFGAAGVIVAAPGHARQQGTVRPGDPTQARVWVENSRLRVEIDGTPTVTLGADSIVAAKFVRQTWEYRVISIPAGQTPTGQQLAAAGADGWEAIGAPFPSSDGVSLLLKRPAR